MKRLRLHLPILFVEWFDMEVCVTPGMTGGELSRRLGVHPPSGLFKWPSGAQVKPEERIYDIIFKQNQRLYIRERNGPHPKESL